MSTICNRDFLFNRTPYRHNALMKRVFEEDRREYSIIVEVYNSKDRIADLKNKCGKNVPTSEQPLGTLQFIKPANRPSYTEWFNQGYYRTGTIRGMEQGSFMFNGNWMNGDDYWRRRFFVCRGYGGCGGDQILMSIPMSTPCNWDRWANTNIIMAADKPVTLEPNISQNDFNCRYVGDIMCVYACIESNEDAAFGKAMIPTSC